MQRSRRVPKERGDVWEEPKPLNEADIAFMKRYACRSPYADVLERIETDIERINDKITRMRGVVPSDTGLAPEEAWDLAGDAAALRDEPGLQVGKVTIVLPPYRDEREQRQWRGAGNDDGEQGKKAQEAAGSSEYRYVVDLTHEANGKYVVGLAAHLSPADVDEDTRVGLDHVKMQIQVPLPAQLEACVSMMQVEEGVVDTDYADIGGCEEQLRMIREVVELPLLHPERFARLGIEPPKGALLFGSPGGGKTLCARAVAGSTAAAFIRIIGSELVQKYIGQGAHLIPLVCVVAPPAYATYDQVREVFALARTKPACILFFDEIDSFGGVRHGGAGEGEGDNEVQRTMLELLNQLDGFDRRGNVKAGIKQCVTYSIIQ